MKGVVLVILLFAVCHRNEARIFDRCSLACELDRLGVPRGVIPNWVCIAHFESTFNTTAIGPPNTDGSCDWGLFQLNDRWWCNPQDGRRTSNACRVACRSLLVDDIGAALRCAQLVQRVQDFNAWTVWNKQCGGGSRVPKIDDCFREETVTIEARIFDRCSLARELSNRGVPRTNIANWVCIRQYEHFQHSGYWVGEHG